MYDRKVQKQGLKVNQIGCCELCFEKKSEYLPCDNPKVKRGRNKGSKRWLRRNMTAKKKKKKKKKNSIAVTSIILRRCVLSQIQRHQILRNFATCFTTDFG